MLNYLYVHLTEVKALAFSFPLFQSCQKNLVLPQMWEIS